MHPSTNKMRVDYQMFFVGTNVRLTTSRRQNTISQRDDCSSENDSAHCSFSRNDGLTIDVYFLFCFSKETLCLHEPLLEVGLSLLTDLVVRWLDSHITSPASFCLILSRFGCCPPPPPRDYVAQLKIWSRILWFYLK
jgi:hypothetical protein